MSILRYAEYTEVCWVYWGMLSVWGMMSVLRYDEYTEVWWVYWGMMSVLRYDEYTEVWRMYWGMMSVLRYDECTDVWARDMLVCWLVCLSVTKNCYQQVFLKVHWGASFLVTLVSVFRRPTRHSYHNHATRKLLFKIKANNKPLYHSLCFSEQNWKQNTQQLKTLL